MTAVVDLGQPADELARPRCDASSPTSRSACSSRTRRGRRSARSSTSDLDALLTAVDINCRAPIVLVARARSRAWSRGAAAGSSSCRRSPPRPAPRTSRCTRRRRRSTSCSPKASGTSCEITVSTSSRSVRARPEPPGGSRRQPPSGDLAGVMEPADVVRDALAALGHDSVDRRGRREPRRRGRCSAAWPAAT